MTTEEVKAISDEALRRQVARYAGWTGCRTDEWCDSAWGHPPQENDMYPVRPVPVFPSDFDAMHEVLMSLSTENRKAVGECLIEIVKPLRMCHDEVAFAVLSASCRQLAEAFVVVMSESQCACHRGSTCDISHDPATCSCEQCTTAEKKASEKKGARS